MRFGEYLVSKGRLEKSDAVKVSTIQKESKLPLGKLAIEEKILTHEDVLSIRSLQRKMKARFGTVAVDLNLLSVSQVDHLIDLQMTRKPLFGEVLVKNDYLSPQELMDELDFFNLYRPAGPVQNKSIALIGLEKGLLEEMENSFGRRGYEIVASAFTEENLGKVFSEKPDFIIVNLDKKLKGICKAFGKLKKDVETPSVNILAMVSRLTPTDAKVARSAGIEEFVPPTAPVEIVVDYVDSILEKVGLEEVETVLLLDDSPTVLKLTSFVLEQSGYKTLLAESGSEALEILEKTTPELILSDIHMPGMDGVEFCRLVKHNALYRNIPLLMVTADRKSDKIKEALDAGASDYIVKPFQNEELLARVRAHIRTKRLFDEIQKSRKELLAANEKLAESDQKKTEFLATVAHDLRTPLTSIRTFSHLLGLYKGKPEQEEFIEVINAETIRMTGLIENYLNVSMIESGASRFRKEEINLTEMAHYLVKVYGRVAENRLVRIETVLPDEHLYFIGDGDRFSQVISNLLDNAIKFTEKGGKVILKLKTVGRGKKKYIEIIVSDTGCGIAEEFLKNIFQRYHHLPNVNEFIKGTGLGLSICKEIVESHSGKIYVKSVVGEGTDFRILIPMFKPEPEKTSKKDIEEKKP